MANQVTETIQHFIGYLHIAELLNLRPVHYEGAPVYKPMAFDDGAAVRPWALSVELPDRGAPNKPTEPGYEPSDFTDALPQKLGPVLQFGPLRAFIPLPERPLPPAVQPFEPIYAVGLPDITVSYTHGGRQDQWLDIVQTNALRDNDTVIDLEAMIGSAEVPPEVYAALSGMVALALEQVPAAAFIPFDLPSGVEKVHLSISEDVAISLASPDASSSGQAVPGNGTYVDAVRISDAGESFSAQAATLSDMVDQIREEGEFGDDRQPTHKPPSNVDAEAGYVPMAAQHFYAGGNEQINVAAIYDLGDAFGSRIIRGDYREINVIAQINVLSDDDHGGKHGKGHGGKHAKDDAVLGLVADSNLLRNEASFINEPGDVSGLVPTRGFSGVTDWRVDYVHGHFVDISMVTQRNFMTDLDYGDVEQTQAYHLVTFGENDQLNVANLLELGKQYDLIIIAGDYYKYNAILQFNIVLDDDLAEQISKGGGSTSSTGGNVLQNDAAIVGTGGKTFHALNEDVTALADAVAAGDTTIDPYITLGLPGGGDDGTIDVLYVTGSYYNFNIILQTNIIADLDDLSQRADADGDFDQLIESGGNVILNGALIYDLDSQSDYQFLGGSVYEDTILVQANILVDEDELPDDDDARYDDAVAVVAALSDDAGYDIPLPDPVITTTGGEDVMGGILT